MSFENFNDLEITLTELFQKKKLKDALDLITREGSNFSDKRVWVDYWHMCAAARVENYPIVYQIAEDAHARGMWYSESIWRTSPSFEILQGDPNFERIVDESRALQDKDAPLNTPVLHVHFPENHSCLSPILIGLHGNETSAQNGSQFWSCAVSQGWVVASPQSNQVLYKGAYVWNDLDAAYTNIQDYFVQLKTKVVFDHKRVVIAGHSLGSFIAIQTALMGIIQVCGFIAIGPIVPNEDQLAELVEVLGPVRDRGIRGYLIIGENANIISMDGCRAFTETLKSVEIESELEIIPGAAHEYSDVYDASLLRALSFVDGIS
jgi:predicted esterase